MAAGVWVCVWVAAVSSGLAQEPSSLPDATPAVEQAPDAAPVALDTALTQAAEAEASSAADQAEPRQERADGASGGALDGREGDGASISDGVSPREGADIVTAGELEDDAVAAGESGVTEAGQSGVEGEAAAALEEDSPDGESADRESADRESREQKSSEQESSEEELLQEDMGQELREAEDEEPRLRDPFWPVGYWPPDPNAVEAEPTNEVAAASNVVEEVAVVEALPELPPEPPTRWDLANRRLRSRIKAFGRGPEGWYAIIGHEILKQGDFITVKVGERSYKYLVLEVGDGQVRFDRIESWIGEAP